MPSRACWPVFAIVALACGLPAAFLALYRRTFGFHPLVVTFGEAVVLLALALLGLAWLGARAARSRSGANGTGAWFCAAISGLLAAFLVFVFAGASISNSAWGDTLNYEIALTFLRHTGGLLDFLPVAPAQKSYLIAGVLAAGIACLLLAFVLAAAAALFLAARLDRWLRASPGKARLLGLSGALGAIAVAAAGFCTASIVLKHRALHGEPITGFFRLVPASSLHQLDNVRLAAALEDIDSRRVYPKAVASKRKHVVLIFADSLRADRTGPYGYRRATTPFLSDLYARKRLHRVDVALSTCSDSYCGVASTFVSRPFHELSVHNFKLHSLLRDQGYRINFFLGGDHRGWNYLFDFYGSDVDAVYDFRSLDKPTGVNDDRILLDALERIDPAGAQPNLFYFFLMSTHQYGLKLPEFARFLPAETDATRITTFWGQVSGMRRAADGSLQQQIMARADVEALSNRYDNGVVQADAHIARIFATLDAKGYLKDSIVVILADHGEGLGEHDHTGHTRYLYQEDIRIPLLIYDDDVERYRNGNFGGLIDIAPTLVERLGLPIPAGWRGHSLMRPPADRMTLHQTRRGHAPCYAVVERAGQSLMKYMRCGDGVYSSDELLFDLVADPQERNNLMASAPASQRERYRRVIDSRIGVVVNRCVSNECRD